MNRQAQHGRSYSRCGLPTPCQQSIGVVGRHMCGPTFKSHPGTTQAYVTTKTMMHMRVCVDLKEYHNLCALL